MSLFAKTMKRKLIDMLYENGLSICYEIVLELSAQLGEVDHSKRIHAGIPNLAYGARHGTHHIHADPNL